MKLKFIFSKDGVHDAFIEKIQARIEKQLKVGDGMDATVNQGPLINVNQFNKVCNLVEDAKSKGAKVVLGGDKAVSAGSLFYQPTILTDINQSMELAKEEIFGPVIPIIRFKHEEV